MSRQNEFLPLPMWRLAIQSPTRMHSSWQRLWNIRPQSLQEIQNSKELNLWPPFSGFESIGLMENVVTVSKRDLPRRERNWIKYLWMTQQFAMIHEIPFTHILRWRKCHPVCPAFETVSQSSFVIARHPSDAVAILIEQGVATPCSTRRAWDYFGRYTLSQWHCDTVRRPESDIIKCFLDTGFRRYDD